MGFSFFEHLRASAHQAEAISARLRRGALTRPEPNAVSPWPRPSMKERTQDEAVG